LGRIAHLIADLYFVGAANPLADCASLQNIFRSVLPATGDYRPRLHIFEGSQGGWYGFGILEGGRISFQTVPPLEFMALEIVAFNRSFDPRTLNEQLVTLLAPSLVTVDVFSRGHHLTG
jgi:S-adenosylmethionine/arginine decarboxylase-like enzyme